MFFFNAVLDTGLAVVREGNGSNNPSSPRPQKIDEGARGLNIVERKLLGFFALLNLNLYSLCVSFRSGRQLVRHAS